MAGQQGKRLRAHDHYQRADGQWGVVLANDFGDVSLAYSGRYDAKCSSCWLGYPHSENLHAARVKQAEREAATCRCGHPLHAAQCPAPEGCWCDDWAS